MIILQNSTLNIWENYINCINEKLTQKKYYNFKDVLEIYTD